MSLFAVVATELIGFGLIIPVLPQIASNFGVSGFAMGFLLASYSLAQFVAAPILGSLSDVYGRRPILVISKIGTIAGYIALALANQYWLFLVARLIDGFTGGNIAVARAYAADITTEKDRSKGMAIIGISFGVGFVLGPALGGLMYGLGGHAPAALLAAALSFAALLMTLFFLKEPPHRAVTKSHAIKLLAFTKIRFSRNVWLLCAAQVVFMMFFSGFETTFSLFTHQRFSFNEQQNSLMFMLSGILILMIQGYFTRKTIAKGHLAVWAGLLFCSASFLILGAVNHVQWLILDLFFLAFGVCLLNVYLPSLLSTNSGESLRGEVMGIYEGLGSLSRIAGPLLAYVVIVPSFGWLYGVFGLGLIGIFAVFALFYRA